MKTMTLLVFGTIFFSSLLLGKNAHAMIDGGGVIVGDGAPMASDPQEILEEIPQQEAFENLILKLYSYFPKMAGRIHTLNDAFNNHDHVVVHVKTKSTKYYAGFEAEYSIGYLYNISLFFYDDFYNLPVDSSNPKDTTQLKVILHEFVHLLMSFPELKTQRITSLLMQLLKGQGDLKTIQLIQREIKSGYHGISGVEPLSGPLFQKHTKYLNVMGKDWPLLPQFLIDAYHAPMARKDLLVNYFNNKFLASNRFSNWPHRKLNYWSQVEHNHIGTAFLLKFGSEEDILRICSPTISQIAISNVKFELGLKSRTKKVLNETIVNSQLGTTQPIKCDISSLVKNLTEIHLLIQSYRTFPFINREGKKICELDPKKHRPHEAEACTFLKQGYLLKKFSFKRFILNLAQQQDDQQISMAKFATPPFRSDMYKYILATEFQTAFPWASGKYVELDPSETKELLDEMGVYSLEDIKFKALGNKRKSELEVQAGLFGNYFLTLRNVPTHLEVYGDK